MNFGGVDENVVTGEEFPLEKAREIKDETIAVIGYGVQGPTKYELAGTTDSMSSSDKEKARRHRIKRWPTAGFPRVNFFEIEEACQRGTIIEYLLSDAAQIEVWPKVKKTSYRR